jgi:hypothetical protein
VAVLPACTVCELEPPEAIFNPISDPLPSTALPLSATACGLPDALSVTVKLAVMLPALVGLNTTWIVHDCVGCTVVQLLVWENWFALVPLIDTPVTVSAAPPIFVSVTRVTLLLVPQTCDGNDTDVGEKPTPGAGVLVLSRTNAPLELSPRTGSILPSLFMSAGSTQITAETL